MSKQDIPWYERTIKGPNGRTYRPADIMEPAELNAADCEIENEKLQAELAQVKAAARVFLAYVTPNPSFFKLEAQEAYDTLMQAVSSGGGDE